MAVTATFTITVEKEDNTPNRKMVGAECILRWIPPGQGNSKTITSITDADGEATFEDVDCDGHSYNLKVSKGGLFSHAEMNAKIINRPGNIVYFIPRKVTVYFVGAPEIGVTINVAKHAGMLDFCLAGVKVSATGGDYDVSCLTNADGNAAFALPVGIYDFKFEKEGFETFGCEGEVRTDLRDQDPTAPQVVPSDVYMKARANV